MNKYKFSNGKTYYANQPIPEACGECSNNTSGIFGLYKHMGIASCKYFLDHFTKTGEDKKRRYEKT
jgi:hypothetical protein